MQREAQAAGGSCVTGIIACIIRLVTAGLSAPVMSRLVLLADWTGEHRASVVFVHGLDGHPYDTWSHNPSDPKALWPCWLASDITGLAVWTIGYDSPKSEWLGPGMPLLDQAAMILRMLIAEPGLKNGPIMFVCHSLGGLIIKQVLRDAYEQKNIKRIGDFLDRVRNVAFIATPHTGAKKAGFLAWILTLFRRTDTILDLAANRPELRHLNVAYREIAREQNIKHISFFETAKTPIGRIVGPIAADPGLEGPRPIPIHRNHMTIVKPEDKCPSGNKDSELNRL